MTAPAETVAGDMTIDALRARFRASDRHAFAVTGHGHLIGIVTQCDLLRRSGKGVTETAGLATTDVVTVRPDTTVFEATQRLLHEQVRQLLVVDDDRVVGVFGRLDALRVSELQETREAVQPGWLSRHPRLRLPGSGPESLERSRQL